MKKNLLTILAAAAGTFPIVSQAQIVNGGFESGLAGWTITAGDTANSLADFGASGSLPGISNPGQTTVNPTQGTQFGLISDSLLNFSGFGDTETISQTFTVASVGTLNVDYRFWTEAVNQPAYNPSAQITLTPAGGSAITLASISRNDLQANPAGAGPLSPGAAFAVAGDPDDIGQSAWQTATLNLSSYVGQNVTLSFSISQDASPDDSFLTDALAIDNINITPVPEPADYWLVAGGLGFLACLKFVRPKK